MIYPHAIPAQANEHMVMVALALEEDDHSTGILCTHATIQGSDLILDDAVVFEDGQYRGYLSTALQQAINGPLITRRLQDWVTLRAFLSNDTPTAGQAVAALKAQIRTSWRLKAIRG